MKKIFQITLLFSFLLTASQALAQDGATTSGPVWRFTYIKIKPGKGADYTKWMREYRTRILAEQKSAGLIVDYKFFSKPTGDNSTGDWDIAGAVMYRNYPRKKKCPGCAIPAKVTEKGRSSERVVLPFFLA